MSPLRTVLYSGTGAALFSLGAIALLSKLEGRQAYRPINATSHVLWGPKEATRDGIDARRTLPGLVINIGAAFFWATAFTLAIPRRSRPADSTVIGTAFMTSLVAAIVDYGLVPKRLRPGWELALKPPSVAIALAAMGAGLAAGGLASRHVEPLHEDRRLSLEDRQERDR